MTKKAKWLLGFMSLLAVVIGLKLSFLADPERRVSTGRILVHLEQDTPFTPEEFLKATNSKLIAIDPRNPFIALQDIYLDYPVIVISQKPAGSIYPKTLAKKFGYRYLPLSNISLEDAIHELEIGLSNVPKYSSQIPYLSPEESYKIYDLMQRIDEVFTKNHLTFWATAGTLLGAVRHQGLIPWDDDLDVCIFDFDEERLKSLHAELEKSGLEIHYYWKDFYKIYPKDGALIPDLDHPGSFLPFKYPFADIFLVTLEKNKEFHDVYVHKSKEFYFSFNGEWFAYSQLQNLQRVPFGPINIPIPSNAENFLNSSYGTKSYPAIWKKYAIEPSWIHKTESSSKISGTALVEIDDFSSAPLNTF